MLKYGVELDEATKEGQYGQKKEGTCPSCGQKLDSGGACPTHGTEPMEKRPAPKIPDSRNG